MDKYLFYTILEENNDEQYTVSSGSDNYFDNTNRRNCYGMHGNIFLFIMESQTKGFAYTEGYLQKTAV